MAQKHWMLLAFEAKASDFDTLSQRNRWTSLE